jgi:hypothetical protein
VAAEAPAAAVEQGGSTRRDGGPRRAVRASPPRSRPRAAEAPLVPRKSEKDEKKEKQERGANGALIVE